MDKFIPKTCEISDSSSYIWFLSVTQDIFLKFFSTFNQRQQLFYARLKNFKNFKTYTRSPWNFCRTFTSLCRYRKFFFIFGNLGLVYIWSCFITCPLFLLFNVSLVLFCAPELTEGTISSRRVLTFGVIS